MATWNEAMHKKAEHQFFPTVSTNDYTHASISYNEDNLYTVYAHKQEKTELDTVSYDKVPGVLAANKIPNNNWK